MVDKLNGYINNDNNNNSNTNDNDNGNDNSNDNDGDGDVDNDCRSISQIFPHQFPEVYDINCVRTVFAL